MVMAAVVAEIATTNCVFISFYLHRAKKEQIMFLLSPKLIWMSRPCASNCFISVGIDRSPNDNSTHCVFRPKQKVPYDRKLTTTDKWDARCQLLSHKMCKWILKFRYPRRCGRVRFQFAAFDCIYRVNAKGFRLLRDARLNGNIRPNIKYEALSIRHSCLSSCAPMKRNSGRWQKWRETKQQNWFSLHWMRTTVHFGFAQIESISNIENDNHVIIVCAFFVCTTEDAHNNTFDGCCFRFYS